MALRVPPLVPWNIVQAVSRPVIDQLSSSRQSSLARGDEQTIVLNNAALYQDPAVAAARCFDRVTSASVSQETLKTYRQALNQYHLHPETKFAHGDYLDAGPTARGDEPASECGGRGLTVLPVDDVVPIRSLRRRPP